MLSDRPFFSTNRIVRRIQTAFVALVLAGAILIVLFSGLFSGSSKTEAGTCISDGHGGYSAVAFKDRVETGWYYTAQCGR